MRRISSVYERVIFFFGYRGPMFFAFRTRVNADIKKIDLQSVLDKLQKKHPMAGIRVEMDDNYQQYIDTENVPSIPVKEYGSDYRWQGILKEELKTPFDMFRGPLLRFAIRKEQQNTDIIAVFHHAIVDGMGGVIFMDELFTILANPDMHINNYEYTPPFLDMFPDALADKFSKQDPPDWIKDREKHFDIKEPYFKYSAPNIKDYPNPDFNINAWTLDKDITNKLIKISKDNNVSVHGVVGAILFKAFQNVLGSEENFKNVIQSPINLRPFLKPETNEIMGLFNGLLTTEMKDHLMDDIFVMAKYLTQDIRGKLDKDLPLSGYYYFNKFFSEKINCQESVFQTWINNPIEYDFSFSNLGKINIQKNYGKYVIEEFQGPIFSAIKGEKVIGVNTCLGEMHFTLIYDKECFDDEKGKLIVENFHKIFKENIV